MDPQALRPFVSCPLRCGLTWKLISEGKVVWRSHGDRTGAWNHRNMCATASIPSKKVAGSRGVVLDLECGLFRGHRVLRVGVGRNLSSSNVQDFLR